MASLQVSSNEGTCNAEEMDLDAIEKMIWECNEKKDLMK